jgi:hypothetical protein
VNEGAAAIERFRALLEEAQPATGGVPIRELVAQAAAVLPLLDELPATDSAAGVLDSFAFRECFTALTWLGRRLALLDLTPTSTIQIVELALAANDPAAQRSAGSFERRATAAAIEGFVMGREERVLQLAEDRAAKTLKPVRLDDGVLALFISGVHNPTVLSECIDALGRAMLDTGAHAAIVDLSQLGEPNRERVAAMLSADEVTRMLGGVCFFTGLDWRWKEVARRSHIALEELRIMPSVAEALAAARNQPRRPSERTHLKWESLLRRLRR